MDKLSDEYKDKAGFYYADVEDGGNKYRFSQGLEVSNSIIYKKGVEVDRKVRNILKSHERIFVIKIFNLNLTLQQPHTKIL